MRAYLVAGLAVAGCGRGGFERVATDASGAPNASTACALPAPWIDIDGTYTTGSGATTPGADQP